MRPEPEPKATTATIIDTTTPRVRSARGRGAADGLFGVVMRSMMVFVCGLCAAGLAIAGEKSPAFKPAAPLELAALASPSIAGRWSGTPHAIKHDASRCGPEGCRLILDVVACGKGWCGIEVDKGDVCGAQAMQLTVHKDKARTNAFEGNLSLGAGTQSYVIEANYEPRDGDVPDRIYLIGDTGPEFMMFRRSFPFHATLARIGEAKCNTNRPVS
jgi:hypothetical protein